MSRTRLGDLELRRGISVSKDTNYNGQGLFTTIPTSSESATTESVCGEKAVGAEKLSYEEISEHGYNVPFHESIVTNRSINKDISKQILHRPISSHELLGEKTCKERGRKHIEGTSSAQVRNNTETTDLSKFRDTVNSFTKRDSLTIQSNSLAHESNPTLMISKSNTEENGSYVEDDLLPSSAELIEDLPLVPPDGGWGWLAALGAFIVMTLIPSVGACFSILFADYLIEQKASSATTSWIYNTQVFIWHLIGPLVGPLVTEFGGRKIGFVGVTLVSLSMIISAFSPSVGFLFFSFSFLAGIGGGLAATLCFILVPQYFRRRQGTANAILMAGVCMMQIAMVPLSRYLLDEFSFKPACLIYGALLLNGLVGISVLHPVEWHMKREKIDKDSKMLKVQESRVKTMEAEPSSNKFRKESSFLEKCSRPNKTRDHQRKSKSPTDSEDPKSQFHLLLEIGQRVVKQALLNCKVMKMFRAIIIINSIALSVVGYGNFLMMLPFAMKTMGFSLKDASYVISLFGMSNMITRVTVSPLSDWKRFSKKACIMSGYAVVAICIFVFPYLTSFKLMMALGVIAGCGTGANMAMNNLVMIQYLGIENLAATLGVTILEVGVFAITFGPFIGFVRDITDSYTYSIWTLAGMLATSFCLWLFMPAAILWDTRETTKTQVER